MTEPSKNLVQVFNALSGNFTIKAPIPDDIDLPLKDDHSIPVSTLDVQTEKLRTAVTVLSYLGQMPEDLEALVQEAIWSKLRDDAATLIPHEKHYDPLREAVEHYDLIADVEDPTVFTLYDQLYWTLTEWLEITIEFEAAGVDDSEDAETTHMIHLHAQTPGLRAFDALMRHATDPHTLEHEVMRRLHHVDDETF